MCARGPQKRVDAPGQPDPLASAEKSPHGLLCAFEGCLSGKGVKDSTGSRMRSGGRSPSTERMRIEAKRILDALGTTLRSPSWGRRSKRSAAQPAPLTTEGDSPPFPAGRGGGNGRGWRTWCAVLALSRWPAFSSRPAALMPHVRLFVALAVACWGSSTPRLRGYSTLSVLATSVFSVGR